MKTGITESVLYASLGQALKSPMSMIRRVLHDPAGDSDGPDVVRSGREMLQSSLLISRNISC